MQNNDGSEGSVVLDSGEGLIGILTAAWGTDCSVGLQDCGVGTSDGGVGPSSVKDHRLSSKSIFLTSVVALHICICSVLRLLIVQS